MAQQSPLLECYHRLRHCLPNRKLPLLYNHIHWLTLPFKIYIPVINTVVFKHAPITWEWAVVFVASILFMCSVEAWKYTKRVFFRMQDRKIGFVRSETLDDQRYDPMQQIC